MPRRSRDANEPLYAVELAKACVVNGVVCRRIVRGPARIVNAAVSTLITPDLDLKGSRILVDKTFWMPIGSGLVVGWTLAKDAP